MTPQERELLEALFARVRTAPAIAPDPEAQAYIAEQIRLLPQAAYLLSQTVIIQEETLKAAAAKIDEINLRVAELEEAQRAAQTQPASFLGGIGKSIFGGQDPAPVGARGSVPSAGGARDFAAVNSDAPRSAGIGMPNVAPPANRWTQQGRPIAGAEQPPQAGGGGSFLKGALGAAAGVAGGMLLANSLGGLFKDSNNPVAAADAKGGQKSEPQGSAATPASDQERQPWGGAESRQDTSSAEDDGFDSSAFDDDQGGDGGWSDDS
jgi:hypothetical protein